MVDVALMAEMQNPSLPIRKVNVEKDLGQIADLIEICFGDQMDEDGHEYLRQIRRAAKDVRQIIWARGSNEWVAMPMHGYVYLDGERIIGNVTLVPFQKSGCWVYLICNVAVHPEYRRRGIGRLMTVKGMEHIRRQKAQASWLQVRVDNLPAIHLYETLGFQHRAVRTLWRVAPGQPFGITPSELSIHPRKQEEWPVQRDWLEKTYPGEVAWNLPFKSDAFRPGLWRWLVNYFRSDRVENWSAYRGKQICGSVSWKESNFHQESLWPVIIQEGDDEALCALLTFIRQRMRTHRSVVVNYPAGQAESGFLQAGFSKVNTLIWMEAPIDLLATPD